MCMKDDIPNPKYFNGDKVKGDNKYTPKMKTPLL